MKNKFLLALLLSLFARALIAQQPQSDEILKKAITDSLAKALNRYYVYPEKARLMADFLKQEYDKGKYASLKADGQLADQLAEGIRSVHNDRHLRVEYNPRLEQDIVRFLSSKKDAEAVSQADIAREKADNFYFRKLEILPGNIAYLEFTNFPLPGAGARKVIRSAMEFVANSDALVIDLRNNRGGNAVTKKEILGYFFNQKTKTGRSYSRLTNTWEDNFVENTSPPNNRLVLDMPLYILTARKTFSAAEGFAYVLQQQRGASVIGSPSSGGAHLTRSFSLGNGFVAFIPYTRSENEKTKTDWEGTGVTPDLLTSTDPLLTAQTEILKVKLTKTPDEREKRKIQWLINYYVSQTNPFVLATTLNHKYTGNFSEFEISTQHDVLHFRDVNQKDKKYFPLIPVSQTLFQVAKDYQIEFVEESGNQFKAIRVSWSDGYAERIERSK